MRVARSEQHSLSGTQVRGRVPLSWTTPIGARASAARTSRACSRRRVREPPRRPARSRKLPTRQNSAGAPPPRSPPASRQLVPGANGVGPGRALGNRCIVCDPRRADMKAILNAKIKRRESFRPFALSVLEEAVSECFEEDDAVPFMMQVFQIREEKRAAIPAVTHVDGSGRLQTVSARTNPRYWRLIDAFRDLTGVSMVLNTSFNENEPVVCTPEEALDCFLRTSMDLLVLGNVTISREDGAAA